MSRILFAVTAALCFGAANASTVDPRLAKSDVCGRYEIFHINGIMTTRPDAQRNLERIQAIYGNAFQEHLIYYGLAYNQTRDFASDFYDSVLQVISGYAGATWEGFMNAVTFGIYTLMPDTLAKVIAKKVTDLYAFTKPAPYQDWDLADIMIDFSLQHKKHARMLIIPHSQGNLYANLVYDRLIDAGWPAKSIGVIGVAVPYASVRAGNRHVTSSNDVVIDAVRKVTPVIDPNVTIPLDPAVDHLGHNLRATYLANSTAASKLRSHIASAFFGLRTTSSNPTQFLMTRPHGRVCGTGPYLCWESVPTGAPYQYYWNVNINYFNIASVPAQQHELGTPADLDQRNRAHNAACYLWYLSDRKAVIKALGRVPTSQYDYPYHTYGSCGSGFPWQTPYGKADMAWAIYSADSSTLKSTAWYETSWTYYNQLERRPLCKQ